MPYNGSGVFSVYTPGTPYVTGTIISSTIANNVNSDFAVGLSTAITKNGQTTVTANIPFAGNRLTGVGAGTSATDAANVSQIQNSTSQYLTTVVGADTITANATPTLTAYAAGQRFSFIAAGTNTTAVTLNISGLGAKAITRSGTIALAAGDIPSGSVVNVVYDGTEFQLVSLPANDNSAIRRTVASSATTSDIFAGSANDIDWTGTTTATGFPAAPIAGASRLLICAAGASFTAGANMLIDGYASGQTVTLAANDFVEVHAITTTQFRLNIRQYSGIAVASSIRGLITGCTMSTAGASATMSIAAGVAEDSTNAILMTLAAIAKTTSAWAVGTGNGGIDTGAIANTTWYHFYVIRRPDTGVVDVTFSTNATTPTLPANYTQYRRIGSGLTNGSAQWVKFFQDGRLFTWDVPVLDINVTNPGTAAVTRTLASVPTGVVVYPVAIVEGQAVTSANILILMTSLQQTDTAPGGSVGDITLNSTSADRANTPLRLIATNTSAQIRSRQSASGASDVFRILTCGWWDYAGTTS